MKNLIVPFLFVFPLAGCFGDGGPSEKEMRAAFEQKVKQVGLFVQVAEVTSFKKYECHAMGGGQWRCSFDVRFSNGNSANETAIFEDRGASWAMQ